MGQIWKTALASFALCGFAAVVSAAAIAASQDHPARADGRAMMIESSYRLATALKR